MRLGEPRNVGEGDRDGDWNRLDKYKIKYWSRRVCAVKWTDEEGFLPEAC
jgi:hypothetical protein